MLDDDIYRILTHLYQFESKLKTGYLLNYALSALKRDIKNSKSIHDLNLRKLPSNQVIEMEKKHNKDEKRAKKHKNKQKQKEKEDNKMEYEEDEEDEEKKKRDRLDQRPECLFYRILTFILDNDPEFQKFINLICIHIAHKVLNNKTTPDTDENHYMAYDLLFETVFSQTLKENSTSQIEQLSKARKNEIEEIVKSIITELSKSPICLRIDKGSERFKMDTFFDEKYDDMERDNDVYPLSLSEDIQLFLKKMYEVLKNNYSQTADYYLLQSKVLELIFEHVKIKLSDPKINLLPFLKLSSNKMSLKKTCDQLVNHKFNFKNITTVLV